MNTHAKFLYGQHYHVYNRTNNKEKLFLFDDNRRYFLNRYKHYLSPFLHIHAYALMGNHFHFCVKVKTRKGIDLYLHELSRKERTKTIEKYLISKDKESIIDKVIISQHHRFFISYVQSFNKKYNRDGNLLHKKFKRSFFNPDSKFNYMLYYIHHNARKHGITDDFKAYRWTSYHDILNGDKWLIDIEYIKDYFGGIHKFIDFHETVHYEDKFQGLIVETSDHFE